LPVPSLLYGSESWTLIKKHLQQIEAAEMRLLRPVAGYRRRDEGRSKYIRQELNTY
jgi:hypothetical protein